MALIPLKTAQFAEVRLVGESLSEASEQTGGVPVGLGTAPNEVITHTVGIAMNLRFNENLGSSQRNVIGTPVPIFIPGFYQATITAEKATLNLESWKTNVNINPYTAYLPNTYNIEEQGLDFSGTPYAGTAELAETQNRVPRFLFGLYVYDRIEQEASRPVGMFVCMLQSYSNAITANDAVIMEDITLLARPVYGSWFSVLSGNFNLSTYFGYSPRILPQKGAAAGTGGGGGSPEQIASQ